MEITPFNYLEIYQYIVSNDLETTRDTIEEHIKSLAELEEGWNYGEGSPLSQGAVIRALEIYKLGKEHALDTEVFPVGEGEVELSFSILDHFIDVLVKNDGTFNLYYEIGIGENYIEKESLKDASLAEIKARIKDLAEIDRCVLLESCASTTTAEKRNDLLHVVSGTAGEAFQLWTDHASMPSIGSQPAPIWQNYIQP